MLRDELTIDDLVLVALNREGVHDFLESSIESFAEVARCTARNPPSRSEFDELIERAESNVEHAEGLPVRSRLGD